MRKWINIVRSLVIALALAIASPFALAQTTARSAAERPERTPAGDSDLGLLIILGVIALFVLIAWLISRMGDDGGRGPDHTIL